MSGDRQQIPGTVSRGALAVMILFAGGLTIAALTGHSQVFAPVLLTVLLEGLAAAAILLAAGGYGYLLIRAVAPASAPLGLRVATATALGLWMISTAVLAAGAAGAGLLQGWLWWPIIGAGALLAAFQARQRIGAWSLAGRVDYAAAMLWVAISVAAAFWLTGAARPPGLHFTADSYDVLEYHLQVPREFLAAGRIGALGHNVYSHYPLGVEMLFLLGMVLRGGAYEGMYLAQILHGSFAALAVAAVYASLKDSDAWRARLGAGLLATTPMLVYLGMLAMVELAQVCYTAVALLWLGQWLDRACWRSALCAGLMLGGACAAKYLSVGLAAGPVLAVMLAASVRSARRVGQTLLAGALTVIILSPWLVRNYAHTGNPVFPLATEILGRGDWPTECEQRWIAGHGPAQRPPVPEPPGWQGRPRPRLELFRRNFVADQTLGAMVLLSLAATMALFARRQRAPRWDWALAGVLAGQLAVWAAATHEMPTRFLAPALPTMSLLAAGMLSALSRVQYNPFRRRTAGPPGAPWGAVAASIVGTAAMLVNLLIVYYLHRSVTAGRPVPPVDGRAIAEQYASEIRAPGPSRLMLVGEARAFYFPPDTIYATVFNAHPLEDMVARGLSPEQTVSALRELGLTHLWVNWSEIWRLADTYGFPSALSAELFARRDGGQRPDLGILRDLRGAGASAVGDLETFQPRRPWEDKPPQLTWPLITVYVLPGASTASAPAGGGNERTRP